MTTTITFDANLSVADAVAAYRAASVGDKTRMRDTCRDAIMDAAFMDDNGATARHLVTISRELVAAPKSGPAPVDYAQQVRDRRATLLGALNAIDRGEFTLPDGITIPDGTDLSGVGTPDMKAITAMTTIVGRKVGRGDVAAYVDSVLGDDGMTVGQMRAAWVASEDYPKAPPSTGAISAMLDRDGGAEYGIVDWTDAKGTRGAIREA